MKTGVFMNSESGYPAPFKGSTEALGSNNIVFDANLSNTVYGTSDTVQPPALVLIPQIKY